MSSHLCGGFRLFGWSIEGFQYFKGFPCADADFHRLDPWLCGLSGVIIHRTPISFCRIRLCILFWHYSSHFFICRRLPNEWLAHHDLSLTALLYSSYSLCPYSIPLCKSATHHSPLWSPISPLCETTSSHSIPPLPALHIGPFPPTRSPVYLCC